jgi:hypothetical protein
MFDVPRASPTGDIVDAIVMGPGVNAAVLVTDTVTSTYTLSTVLNDVLESVILRVGVVAVKVAPLIDALKVDDGTMVKVSVTPVGIPTAVNRSSVLFRLPLLLPLLESCAGERQADAKPSVITNDALSSTTFLFVKTVAVCSFLLLSMPPMTMVEMPGDSELITVAVFVPMR